MVAVKKCRNYITFAYASQLTDDVDCDDDDDDNFVDDAPDDADDDENNTNIKRPRHGSKQTARSFKRQFKPIQLRAFSSSIQPQLK